MPQVNITVDINENIYLRDPLETDLGKRIIEHAILLLDEIGFEDLNFKKLAHHMKSTEASLYRYFENKYMLLAYLVAWYWDIMHFTLLMDIRNIKEPKKKLIRSVETLVNSLNESTTPSYIDQNKLHNIVVENAAKVYHTKKVDTLNKEGFYINYKKIVKTLSEIIREIDCDFKYPRALATNIIEQSLDSEYYLDHLPSLTDTQSRSTDSKNETVKMITYMLDRIL
ncbi:TetR/AcrR family transcriptional regulator [Portibacter marinus]|uniref:TetR/AcrR family transcriptional regulator n=1 Tax=Portibacter marinus TaxID=2898660 RepID=UPI001F224BDC|nr:TetR/AcrR family transcriptional regulator [Portibacter marinus]